MEHQGKWLEEFLASRKHYDQEGPEVWRRTLQAYRAAFADGVITSRYKHLMAVCIGIREQCPPCTIGHVRAALEAGATKDELLEVIGVTLSMCGTGAMGGAWRVLKLMEEEQMF